jgi:hypothetical protein
MRSYLLIRRKDHRSGKKEHWISKKNEKKEGNCRPPSFLMRKPAGETMRQSHI